MKLRQSLQRMALRAKIREVGIGQIRIDAILLFLPYLHQLFRMVKWQRSQQYTVHNAEDGGCGTDAERQSKHSNQSEAGIATQHTGSITQVLQQSPHPVASPYTASNFLNQRHVSHFAARGVMGFVGTGTAINAIL